MPQEPNSAARSAAKAAAARAAMDRLAKTNPALRQKIITDFSAAGWKWNATVAADVRMVAAIDPKGAAAIRAALTDPKVVADEMARGLSPIAGGLSGIGSGVAAGAGAVGGAPSGLLGPIGEGLHAAGVQVPAFLTALTDPNTWLRVVEVALGAVLIVVGLVKLAPPSVTRNLKTAGKVAALL